MISSERFQISESTFEAFVILLNPTFCIFSDSANKVKDVVVQESNGHAEDEDAVEDVKTMQETNHDRKDQAEVTGPT